MPHSKLPWKASPEDPISGGTWNIDTPEGKAIASTWPGDLGAEAAEANANLIITAVNMMPEVKDLLQRSLKMIDKTSGRSADELRIEIDDLLEKLEGVS